MVFGTSTLMTSDLIRRTLHHAQGSQRQAVNQLAEQFSPSQTEMVLQFPIEGFQIGQLIELGWITYTVATVNTATKTVGVVPTIEGTAGTHPSGSRVTVQPRYPAKRIIQAINEDLADLSIRGLYRLVNVAANTETKIVEAADIPDGALTVLAAWSREQGLDPRPLPAAFYRFADTPDGTVLRGPETLEYVTFGCLLNPLSLDTDQVVDTTTGLASTALDIPPMSAAISLLSGTEAQRGIIDVQSETRRAGEVPPGSNTNSMRSLVVLRQRRISAEAHRLQQRFGYIKEVSPIHG